MNSIPVSFVTLDEDKYQALNKKDVGTFYQTPENLYLGNSLLSSHTATKDRLGIMQPNNESITADDGKLNLVWDPVGSLVESQNVVSVPIAKGTLIYTGSTQTARFINYDPAKLDMTGNTGINAGTYTAWFTPKPGYVWEDETAESKLVLWEIHKSRIQVSEGIISLEYTGKEQFPTLPVYDSAIVDIIGLSPQWDIGTYTATLHLVDTDNYMWEDGTVEDKTIIWEIR